MPYESEKSALYSNDWNPVYDHNMPLYTTLDDGIPEIPRLIRQRAVPLLIIPDDEQYPELESPTIIAQTNNRPNSRRTNTQTSRRRKSTPYPRVKIRKSIVTLQRPLILQPIIINRSIHNNK
jgi:hypothetical protein